MVIGYIGIYFLSLFFWHHYVKKILPIRFIFICKDVLSYLIISVLLFVLLSYILSGMTNLYILLFAKIFLYTIFYILSLRLLGSKIFEDCLEFVKSKMQKIAKKANKINRKIAAILAARLWVSFIACLCILSQIYSPAPTPLSSSAAQPG